MRNEIQSTFSTSKSKNVRTAKRKKKKRRRREKKKSRRLAREKSNKRFRPMDRWIFMRIFMVRDKRPILLRSSRSASPRWWWSAVFTVCFERKYNEFSGVAPPANASGGAIHPYRVTDFSRGITRGYRIVPRIHESAIVSIFPSIPSPLLSPLCAFVSSKCFLIFLARASACIMELVSEKFPRMFFFSPLLDFIFLLLLFFFLDDVCNRDFTERGRKTIVVVIFCKHYCPRHFFFWKSFGKIVRKRIGILFLKG